MAEKAAISPIGPIPFDQPPGLPGQSIRIFHMSSTSQRDLPLTSPVKEIRYRHWPLRDQPWRSVVLLTIVGCASVLAARAAGNLWAGFAACLALIICLWRMWLPVEFEFSSRGVVQTYWGRQLRVPWRDIARVEFKERGLLLHATEDTTAVGYMRSIFVRYPPQSEQLRELIEFEMGRWAQRTSSSIETSKRQPPPPPPPADGDEPPPPFVLS